MGLLGLDSIRLKVVKQVEVKAQYAPLIRPEGPSAPLILLETNPIL